MEERVKEMSFKSEVKGRGSDRWWARRWWLWWGDLRRMRWTRRTVNTMKLTEWRKEGSWFHRWGDAWRVDCWRHLWYHVTMTSFSWRYKITTFKVDAFGN